MQNPKCYLLIIIIFLVKSSVAQNTTAVSHFDKVIVSPHIQVTFVEGAEESVTVESTSVNKEKINMEVNNNTLRVYLDGAKEVTKNEKSDDKGHNEKNPIYNGTVVKATITYKTLNTLSLRGGEIHICKSLLKGSKFKLQIYGESQVSLNEVNLQELQATIYGESTLAFKAGSVKDQKYTVYGESKINSLNIPGTTAKIVAYGAADFRVNVSDEIKITAFGNATLSYKGDPQISKGIQVGDLKINKIDQVF
ncbi:MAG: head GIN domain-containing protein [Sphingobacteriaceae bacterium]